MHHIQLFGRKNNQCNVVIYSNSQEKGLQSLRNKRLKTCSSSSSDLSRMLVLVTIIGHNGMIQGERK